LRGAGVSNPIGTALLFALSEASFVQSTSFKSHRDCFIIATQLVKNSYLGVSNPIGTALLWNISTIGIIARIVSNPIGTALLFCYIFSLFIAGAKFQIP